MLRRIADQSVTGLKIEHVWVPVQEALCLLLPALQLLLPQVNQTRTSLTLGNELPYVVIGFIATSVASGGNTRGMNAVILKRRSTLFVVKIHGILQQLVSVTASTITRCTLSTSLQEVGGTQVLLQRVLLLPPRKVLCQKTRCSEEVTAASPLTT